ncbi:hypothetical protein PR202_ga29645 [Eleusine coracana subsp. coracana]|uniref:F-box domain-containing protein n=1 Tax=Eleusine coracana subsp. coracana TaxID=191504 RepID=A0AAV5DLX8_ELECO|nr:hypothetical protein PR202_ga29645 [Eleusine coracana subsp. coracana]
MGGEDSSGLPDELLHGILVGLGSVRAAARTCVLSQRWRHVWKQLPELVLFCDRDHDELPTSSYTNSVDAVLAAYSAPVVELLWITPPNDYHRRIRVPAGRVEPWLRFASQRVVGRLCLYVDDEANIVEDELEIPVCPGAIEIRFSSMEDGGFGSHRLLNPSRRSRS